MLYQDLMCLDLGFLRVRRSRQVLAGYSALSLFHLVPFWQLWDLTSEYMNFLMSGSSTPACPARKDPGQPRSVLHRMTTSHVRYPMGTSRLYYRLSANSAMYCDRTIPGSAVCWLRIFPPDCSASFDIAGPPGTSF